MCFLILYVDDGLITGEEEALQVVMDALSKRYKCKWEEPKDYLGMDLVIKPGKVPVSMETFMDRKVQELGLIDSYRGEVMGPHFTHKCIARDDDTLLLSPTNYTDTRPAPLA